MKAPTFSGGGLVPFTVNEAVQDLRAYAALDHSRFGTGWSIDELCGQIGLGEMALMWARSGSGKSTWTLNVIRNTPTVPTVVVNMEMTPRRQVEWLTSMTFPLSTRGRDIEEVLRYGDDDDRHQELATALDGLGGVYPNLHFVSPSRPSVADLSVVLDDIEDATGVRPVRVYLDHLGLMAGTEDGYAGYTRLTSELHSFAMSENVALVVLQQTGRSDGAGGRNDGHVPVTLSAGVYTGEQDADWVYGLYRPDRHPKYKKGRWDFVSEYDYLEVRTDYEAVKGITMFQVLKNRPMNQVEDQGIELHFCAHTRRLEEKT